MKIESIGKTIGTKDIKIINIADLEAEKERVVDSDTMKSIIQIIEPLVTLAFTQKIHDLEIGGQCTREEDILDLDPEKILIHTVEADEADQKVTKEVMQEQEGIVVLEVAQEVEKLEMIFTPEGLEQTLIRQNF